MLFIFLLNTVTGFSCALYMSHKDHDEANEHHYEHHQHAVKPSVHHHPLAAGTNVGKTEPCCQGAVNNFISLAKLVPQSGHVILNASFVYINFYYRFFLTPLSIVKLNQLILISKRQRPPTDDIRTTIHSFQI